MKGTGVTDTKSVLARIREREMDRKSFLKMSGVLLLGVVGAKSVVTYLSPQTFKSANAKSQKAHGFGAGKYGV